MIDYTFLLPGKNDLCKAHFPHPGIYRKNQCPDHLWPEANPERESAPGSSNRLKEALRSFFRGFF